MSTISWRPSELSGLRDDVNRVFDQIEEGKKKKEWARDKEMLTDLRTRLNQLFGDAWEALEAGEWRHSRWSPAVDISETADELVVTAELPGVRGDEIQARIDRGVLTIEGEKNQSKRDQERHHHQVERPYGSFSRSIRLPLAVGKGEPETSCRSGVFTLKQRKAKRARSKPDPGKDT